MFSLAWPKGRTPASVGDAQMAAFVAALRTRLPGAVVHVTRHISERTCSSSCSHLGRRRAMLATATAGLSSLRRALLTATAPSHASCPGRAVFNAVVAHPNRAQLVHLVRTVELQPSSLWDARQVSSKVLGGCGQEAVPTTWVVVARGGQEHLLLVPPCATR